jgi:hypothetical protein
MQCSLKAGQIPVEAQGCNFGRYLTPQPARLGGWGFGCLSRPLFRQYVQMPVQMPWLLCPSISYQVVDVVSGHSFLTRPALLVVLLPVVVTDASCGMQTYATPVQARPVESVAV